MEEMSERQKASSRQAVARAVEFFHTQGALGMVIGQSQGTVSRLISGDLTVDAHTAMQIERATNKQIKRHELRPDLWDAVERPATIDKFQPSQKGGKQHGKTGSGRELETKGGKAEGGRGARPQKARRGDGR